MWIWIIIFHVVGAGIFYPLLLSRAKEMEANRAGQNENQEELSWIDASSTNKTHPI